MKKPICKECEAKGVKYGVTQGASTSTLLAPVPPFWDENGEYHAPKDPNMTFTQYFCSNLHQWTE